MGATLSIRPHGWNVPFALAYSDPASGSDLSTIPDWSGGNGTDWPGTALDFLLGACYRSYEDDFDFVRYLNMMRPVSPPVLNASRSLYLLETACMNVTPSVDDNVVLSWSKPDPEPDHYILWSRPHSVSGWVVGNTIGRKLLPSSGLIRGNIAGSATTVTIKSYREYSETRVVPVTRSFANGIYIPGNRALSFLGGVASPPASAVTLAANVGGIANGTYTVSAVQVVWSYDGEQTKLTLVGVSTGTGAAGGTCQYEVGPLCARDNENDNHLPNLFLSQEELIGLTPRQMGMPDYTGRMTPQSFLNDSPYSAADFELATGGLSQGTATLDIEAQYRLNKYAREQIPVEFEMWGASGDSNNIVGFRGMLNGQNRNGPAVRQGDNTTFHLDIDTCIRRADERGFHAITTATAAAGGPFVIDGDYTDVFTAGVGFRVIGSTGNDRQYCVSSSAYANGKTTITVTTTPPDGTDDGYIEVYDW